MIRNLQNTLFLLLTIFFTSGTFAQTTLISPTVNNGGFESGAAGWGVSNAGGSTADRWVGGVALSYAGSACAYISNNSGATNTYTGTTARIQHLYTVVNFPAGQPYISLSFNWLCNGEGAASDWDNIKVFVSSVPPVAGVANNAADQVGISWYNLQTTWQTANITLPASLAGTTAYLIFQWKCDASIANQPPGAIDNVTLTTDVTIPPGTGCTSNTTLYPSTSYTPTCIGTPESITSAGYATEYSLVDVTSGTNYIFSSSIDVDYLTIGNNGGGNPVYAFGTTPVTWTATFTGTVRVYNNTNSTCGTNTSIRTRYVQCGTPPVAPPNDNCVGAIPFPPIPADGSCASLTGQGTMGGTNSSVTPSGVCTSNYGTTDEDVWFSFVATATDLKLSATWVSGNTDVYWQVFSAPCGANMTSLLCTDIDAGGTISGMTIGQTYYIRLYTYASSGYTTQDICISNPCPSGSPLNDLPCDAVNIPIGTIASGDNNCAFSSGEPAVPACWTSGTQNTVWFSFIAPPSGSVKIRTAPGTLTSTQIAVYSGACGPSMTMVNCNDNAPDCGYTILNISELILSGLAAGSTYYIAVDGEYELTGTFAITVVDGTANYPSSSGQECVTPITVCNSIITVGDPGYQGIGFTCDQNNTNTTGPNCTTGERGSVWYKIVIDNPGVLKFNIVPNDYTGAFVGDETDYDFLLWKVNGSGATSCAAINSNGGANVVACNYSYLGVTGLGTGGNAPLPYGTGYDAAFEPGIAVAAGDVFLLAVQNYSNSTSGFTLDLTNTGPGVINYGIPATVTWTGGANSSVWTTNVNWGGCTIPTCGINAIISPSSSFQPKITAAMGTMVVKNITIDPGATLTLGSNSVLKICESITNNGTIIADPTSTILFSDDNTAHTMNGTLSGSSSLGNLLITDVAGGSNCTVTANTDLQLKGNFTTSNSNSIFNFVSRNLLIAGNLTNAAGNSTFDATGSTVIFNGTAAQTYSPNENAISPALFLHNVEMDHTGPGVTISTVNTPDMNLDPGGKLTLTNGKIITPNTQQVYIKNGATNAVSPGNTGSYVEGNLRRFIPSSGTGSYDFPVGYATPGYELANINFTSSVPSSFYLTARFDPWGAIWSAPSPGGWGPECGAFIYNAPYLDNGYWSIDATTVATGNYTMTLFNRSYTNPMDGFSIAKSPSAAPAWGLNGVCVVSPVTAVQRTGMSGFSKFATAQYAIVLPVELVSFTGTKLPEQVLLNWTTASEKNSDYFAVERSSDGIHFEKIGTVQAAGTSHQLLQYTLTDEHPMNGDNYYRLKLTDKDATYTYSNIVRINFEMNKTYADNIYPNPGNDILSFDFYAASEDKVEVRLFDYTGRMVLDKDEDVPVGKTSVHTDMNTLAKGVYMVKITSLNTNYTKTQKIIKE